MQHWPPQRVEHRVGLERQHRAHRLTRDARSQVRIGSGAVARTRVCTAHLPPRRRLLLGHRLLIKPMRRTALRRGDGAAHRLDDAAPVLVAHAEAYEEDVLREQ
eukprot:scaffold105679_cov57-Phaeocystis_antarctica.AAC.2